MSNIVHICNSFDPAGDVVRCVTELQKYSRHKHSVVVKDAHPFQDTMQFDDATFTGIPVESIKEVHRKWADAVLYHSVGPEAGYDIKDKPAGFRNATAYYNVKRNEFFAPWDATAKNLQGFKVIGTNHMGAADFLGINTQFLPSLLPIYDEMYLPNFWPRKPCVSMIKNVELFYNAQYTGYPSRQYLYGMSHEKIQHARKHYASVVIDNISDFHWGLAGLEAMSQGLPVVVHNHPKTQQQLFMLDKTDSCPMINADPTVAAFVEAVNNVLTMSEDDYNTYRADIRAWMIRYYNPARLIRLFWEPFVEEMLNAY